MATALAVLMTEARRQPVSVEGEVFHVPVGQRHCVQGAPTSPGLCNAIVAKLDRRLAGLARKFGVNYTRYADDLTFSGDIDEGTVGRLLHNASVIIRAEGFQTNAAKTRVMHRGRRQQVTGVIVNQVLGLSRQQRRRLRAAVHHVATGQPVEEASVVRGKLAYLAMLNADQATRLLRYWHQIGLGKPAATGAVPPEPALTVAPVSLTPAPASALFAGRRFECEEEGTLRFWAVDVVGSEVVVQFGCVGAAPQEQRKTFTTPGAAARERDKLIDSKLAKGYVEKPVVP